MVHGPDRQSLELLDNQQSPKDTRKPQAAVEAQRVSWISEPAWQVQQGASGQGVSRDFISAVAWNPFQQDFAVSRLVVEEAAHKTGFPGDLGRGAPPEMRRAR